jgi:hypothetical protein
VSSAPEGPKSKGFAQPDLPLSSPSAVVPLDGDGDTRTGPDACGSSGEGEIAPDLPDAANPVDSNTPVPSRQMAEAAPDRGRRRVMAFLALLFSLESITLGSFGVVGVVKIADDPALATAQSFGVVPGEQLLSHLDLIRLLLFFATLIAAMAVLTISFIGLVRDARRRGDRATGLERFCLTTATLGHLAAAGVAIAVGLQAQNWYNSTIVLNEPSRNGQATGLALVFFCIFALGAVILRRTPWRVLWKRLLLGLGVCAVIFAGQIAAQQVSIGNYGYYPGRFFNPGTIPPLDIPLTAGFWTVSVLQHPAWYEASSVSCGSPEDCVIFGSGFGHKPGAVGQVTTTTDGGKTWQSWLLPAPLNRVYPFGPFPICRGDECTGPVITTGSDLFHLRITSDGLPSLTITSDNLGVENQEWEHASCPTQTWCAGVTQGYVGQPGPGIFTTSTDGGRTWASHVLPPSILPKGDLLEPPVSVVCPAIDRCVVSGNVAASTSKRGAKSRYSSFIAVTTDGGIRWATGLTVKWPAYINQVSCPDTTHCLADKVTGDSSTSSSATGLLRTDDGGATWHRVATNLDWNGIGSLVCADPEHCQIFVGSGFLSTSNGGSTWVQVPSHLPISISEGPQLACPSVSFCVAVGNASVASRGVESPVVLVTRNGGMTWTQQALPVPKQLP